MRAAAVQLNSTQDRDRNLERADRLTRAAAADGARLIVLPEKFTVIGEHEDYLAGAEPLNGPTLAWAKETARELGVDLVAGSFVERRPGRSKLSNTSVHVGPDGELQAVYRKIHMFDVVVGGVEYRESESEEAGEEIVLSRSADGVPLGLTVCYDLRFPELYRILALEGARVFTVPSAFTTVTGRAHWELLIRARAIENQAFVVAAGQVGQHSAEKESFGASMIVDPWGEVLARAPDHSVEPAAECFVAAELEFDRQERIRQELPSLANRVPDAYRWPEPGVVAEPERV